MRVVLYAVAVWSIVSVPFALLLAQCCSLNDPGDDALEGQDAVKGQPRAVDGRGDRPTTCAPHQRHAAPVTADSPIFYVHP